MQNTMVVGEEMGMGMGMCYVRDRGNGNRSISTIYYPESFSNSLEEYHELH